jgi:peptidoglycan/xylan/chitin deacetylase (PgdA/CDA1 family)
VLIAGYGGYRLWRHTNPAVPAIVTPAMDPAAYAPGGLEARASRLFAHTAPATGPRPKLIALTFDDGPYPVDTPLLLDTLAGLHVHATFFLIGRDGQQYPELVRRIAAAGNEIADHTLSHPDLDRLDAAAVRREIDAGAAVLGALAPDPALRRYLRPPHGRYTVATLRAVAADGYDTVLWTDDPGDWRAIDPATIVAHVSRFATAPEILLLHSGRPATVAALPTLVGRYRAAGYRFVTVGQLLRAVPPAILNAAARTPI